MASSLDQERIEFESHAGQMSLEQLTESLIASEKLIQLSGLPPLLLKFDHSTTLVLLEANLHDSLQETGIIPKILLRWHSGNHKKI